jgi:CDP-paratose synthetase
MKILVTGATGFIGKNLIEALVRQKYEVYVIARTNSDISFLNTNIKVFQYDENIHSLLKFLQKETFDGVIHLASLFLATHTEDDISNLVSSNIKFGIELLEASKKTHVKWFINTGTFWQNYLSEDYNPVNLYAATKEAFEVMVKYYTETSDLIFTTIKLNDTFGPNDTRNKVFNLWSKIAKSGETLEMSAGEQIIDISYIDDVVNAYMILIEHLSSNQKENFKNKTFAVKSDERINLKDLSKIFEDATNTKLNIKWGVKEYREREVMLPWVKGEVVPTWVPKHSLKEAIQKTIGEI